MVSTNSELTARLSELGSLANTIRQINDTTIKLEKENDSRELETVEAAFAQLNPVVDHVVQLHDGRLTVAPETLEPIPEHQRTLTSWAVITETETKNGIVKQLIVSRAGEWFVRYNDSTSCMRTNPHTALTIFGLEEILTGIRTLETKKIEKMEERVKALETRRDQIDAAINQLGGGKTPTQSA